MMVSDGKLELKPGSRAQGCASARNGIVHNKARAIPNRIKRKLRLRMHDKHNHRQDRDRMHFYLIK